MGMNVEEEEEILFSYSTPHSYYVQSPSTTISNATSFEFQPIDNNIHIHDLSSPQTIATHKAKPVEASRRSNFSSSRCSSTRESLMSNVGVNDKLPLVQVSSGNIVGGKKIDDGDDKIGVLGRFVDREKDEYGEDSKGFRKYLSFDTYDSSCWLALQLSWRFVVSLAAALLVFYIVTKPPSPQISIKVGGIREFELAEGVDGSGVSTKIMRINTSIEVIIENHSKVFGLHVLPPIVQMSFQHLTFAASKGEKLVAEREHVTSLELYLGTKSKPMYGAGRMMQDMLDSGAGLPLVVDVSLTSNYQVVRGLIQPWFHHHSRCLVVIVKGYDNKHHTHRFNTTCSMFSSG